MGSGYHMGWKCKEFVPEKGTKIGVGRCKIDGSICFKNRRCPRNERAPTTQQTFGGD